MPDRFPSLPAPRHMLGPVFATPCVCEKFIVCVAHLRCSDRVCILVTQRRTRVLKPHPHATSLDLACRLRTTVETLTARFALSCCCGGFLTIDTPPRRLIRPRTTLNDCETLTVCCCALVALNVCCCALVPWTVCATYLSCSDRFCFRVTLRRTPVLYRQSHNNLGALLPTYDDRSDGHGLCRD